MAQSLGADDWRLSITVPGLVCRGGPVGILDMYMHYKVVHYQPGRGGCVIGGVEASHWDQLKKSGSSWDSNPGPSGYQPGTLNTELLDLCIYMYMNQVINKTTPSLVHINTCT